MAKFKSGGKSLNKFRPSKSLNNANKAPTTPVVLPDRTVIPPGIKGINKFRPKAGIKPALPYITSFKFNQAGVEVWGNYTLTLKFNQVGVEVWNTYTSIVKFNQVGVEVWRTTASGKARRLVNVYYL